MQTNTTPAQPEKLLDQVRDKIRFKQVASMKQRGIEDNRSSANPRFRYAASRLLADWRRLQLMVMCGFNVPRQTAEQMVPNSIHRQEHLPCS